MPSITGGDQLSEEYAPRNRVFVGFDFDPEKCDNFHGYTSNPQLCKACQRSVTEHKTYMARLEKKKAKVPALTDAKRKELMDVCTHEIDEADPLVEFCDNLKFRKSWIDMVRELYENTERSNSMRDFGADQ